MLPQSIEDWVIYAFDLIWRTHKTISELLDRRNSFVIICQYTLKEPMRFVSRNQIVLMVTLAMWLPFVQSSVFTMGYKWTLPTQKLKAIWGNIMLGTRSTKLALCIISDANGVKNSQSKPLRSVADPWFPIPTPKGGAIINWHNFF